MSRRGWSVLGVGAAVLVVAVVGVHWSARGQGSPVTQDELGDDVQTLPRGPMPIFATGGDTATLYRFAAAHGDVLRFMPCTCGCAAAGHTSNRSCYVKGENARSVTYTSHAAT